MTESHQKTTGSNVHSHDEVLCFKYFFLITHPNLTQQSWCELKATRASLVQVNPPAFNCFTKTRGQVLPSGHYVAETYRL